MSDSHRPELHETDATAYQNPGILPGSTGTTDRTYPVPQTGISGTMGSETNTGIATSDTAPGSLQQEPEAPPTIGIRRHGTEHVGQTGHLDGASSMDIKKHNIFGHLEKAVGSLTGNQEMKAAGQAKITESLAASKGADSEAAKAAYMSHGAKRLIGIGGHNMKLKQNVCRNIEFRKGVW
jgi:uncharacterized protein YjbJ (UPF0337 family)